MNFLLSVLTLFSVAYVHAELGEAGILAYPHLERYTDVTHDINNGLLSFPKMNHLDGTHGKRPLTPFSRTGNRAMWRFPLEQELGDFEELAYPVSVAWSGLGRNGFRPLADSSNNLDENEMEKRTSSSNNSGGGMLFGPRLGRRKKRSLETDASTERSRDSLDNQTLMKILHNFNWAIVPVKERRAFIPRLGRRSSDSEEVGVQRRAQGPPYIPRLGRRSGDAASPEANSENGNKSADDS